MFEHLVETVIPLSDTEQVPDGPPIDVPKPPVVNDLGTATADSMQHLPAEKEQEMRQKADECRDELERQGIGARFMMWQKTSAQKVDDSLIGFKIEMLFNYSTDEEEVLVWCNGVVKAVAARSRNVEIEWDDEFVSVGEPKTSKHKLVEGKWNPRGEQRVGSWRQYLTK